MPNPQSDAQSQRYYPTEADLSTPAKARAALQQVLKQHYELADQVSKSAPVSSAVAAAKASAATAGTPSGPTNTFLLGLPVIPVDVSTLADGATLKWNKASGSWKVS